MNSEVTTRACSRQTSKLKPPPISKNWRKRKKPTGGFSEIKNVHSKRCKEFDTDLSESEELVQINYLNNPTQKPWRKLTKFENKWSILRIASKSKIYQWLINGLKTVRIVAPGIMLSLAYNTFNTCNISHNQNYK